jgi:hypothetical protein
MNIAGLELYLYLISQHAASWLDANISSAAKKTTNRFNTFK